jgi:hypothetical protein
LFVTTFQPVEVMANLIDSDTAKTKGARRRRRQCR